MTSDQFTTVLDEEEVSAEELEEEQVGLLKGEKSGGSALWRDWSITQISTPAGSARQSRARPRSTR